MEGYLETEPPLFYDPEFPYYATRKAILEEQAKRRKELELEEAKK